MKTILTLLMVALLVCPVAVAGDSNWTLRFHGAVVRSSGSGYTFTTGGASYRVGVGASGGFGIGAEYRFSERAGLEVSTLFAALETGANASAGSSSLFETLELSITPLTLGVPFHFSVGSRADVYVAPTVSHVIYHDVRTTASRQRLNSSVEVGSDTGFGAAAGLDVDFGAPGSWAVSAGLRYLKASAGGTDVDPLFLTIGFAYRF